VGTVEDYSSQKKKRWWLPIHGRIEVAQHMAGHSNAKTISHYERRNDDVSVGEVERIGE